MDISTLANKLRPDSDQSTITLDPTQLGDDDFTHSLTEALDSLAVSSLLINKRTDITEFFSASEHEIKIVGQTNNLLGLSQLPLQIEVRIVAPTNEPIDLSIEIELPKDWRISSSFPDLAEYPVYDDQTLAFQEMKASFFNDLTLSESRAIYSTFQYQDAKYQIAVIRGLNLLGEIHLDNLDDLIKILNPNGSPIIFHGLVNRLASPPEISLSIENLPNVTLDKLTLKPGLTLYSTLTNDDLLANSYVELQVDMVITEKASFMVTGRIPYGFNGNIDLVGTFEGEAQLTFGDLVNVFGESIVASAPPELTNIESLELQEIQISISNSENKLHLEEVRATIGSSTPWVLVEGLFDINKLQFSVIAHRPLDANQRIVGGEIAASLEFAGGRLDLFADIPDFYISGTLDKSSPINLAELLKEFHFEVEGLSTLEISELEFEADPYAKTFSFDIDIDGHWSLNVLGTAALVIEGLYLSIEDDGGLGGALGGSIELAGVTVSILAECLPGNNSWQFEGSTDQRIELGDLVEDLLEKFGDFQLPTALEGMEIENLSISFNTQSKDFTFTGEIKFPVDGQYLDMVLTIDIKRQEDGSYTKQFSGKITLDDKEGDDLEFDVIFDSKKDSATFIAAYNDPQGHPIVAKDLVSQVSRAIGVVVPGSLQFTLKDALLAYLSKQNDKYYLFGLDIDGGLNLSNLKLPDLPLVGPLFPPDQTLKLSFQLLAAEFPDDSTGFTLDDVSALNALLTTGPKLPARAIDAKLDLSTVLQIGSESKTLDLQIGVRKQDASNDAGSQNTQLSGSTNAPAPSSTTAESTHTGLKPADASSSTPSAASTKSPDGTQWIVLQKAFGPVHLERIGLKFDQSKEEIQGLLDASLTAGGLTISLDGLSVTSPLTKLEPTFDLHGLGIDYRNGQLEIGGSFLKQTITAKGGSPPYTAFSGLAVIRTEKLTISAIGSYANYQDHPSMFIYAILDYPIGGPSFFFVTGLAAGFGYNRRLNIPTIDNVATFPLVAEATGTASSSQEEGQDLLTDELDKLANYIPPSVGENFLAVGIKFNSFKMIDSFALLTVKFGGRLEIDLLGLSTLKSPPPVEGEPPVQPIAEAQLALRATFIPDEGFLGVQAQLTSNSYILSQACHLTGGFAFFSWFKDIKDSAGNDIKGGDFVLTLGGYHPRYEKPSHYPSVPRLGINWRVNDQLTINGDAYFALTPHALMAGGHLEALWHMDGFRAWFNAGADFLINWQPYHYDAHVYVDIGASYTFKLFGTHTITVDLGADLHLWGPEFSGTAVINAHIFSFTIEFGHQSPATLSPIDWDIFKKSFLPSEDQICSIAVQKGLIRQIEDADGTQRWIINPKDFRLVTDSVIPSSQTLSIAPMGLTKTVSSEQRVFIKRDNVDVTDGDFDLAAVQKSLPVALWGDPQMNGDNLKPPELKPPELNPPKRKPLAGSNTGPESLVELNTGFVIAPKKTSETGATHSFDPNNLGNEVILRPDSFRLSEIVGLQTASLRGTDAWDQVDKDLTDPESATNTARRQILNDLGFPSAILDFGESLKDGVMIQGIST